MYFDFSKRFLIPVCIEWCTHTTSIGFRSVTVQFIFVSLLPRFSCRPRLPSRPHIIQDYVRSSLPCCLTGILCTRFVQMLASVLITLGFIQLYLEFQLHLQPLVLDHTRSTWVTIVTRSHKSKVFQRRFLGLTVRFTHG